MSAPSKPKVIACGHRQIETKSGNLFPAFLIRCCGESDHRYFWRSKRDFLVLNRATEHSFPKKAFAKLSDQAQNSGSWVRPDDDEAPSGGYCTLVGDHDVSDNIERNYNPNMKKSLLQLDEFLLKAYSASKEAISVNDDDGKDSIANAWNVFCRPEHTNHLTDSSDSTNNLKTHTPTAARLGQYFASDENARLVIRKLVELLERDSERSTSGSQLVVVEPSCGDGRIISELLNTKKQLKAENVKILGYDIDPTAIERAKANLSGDDVALECKDFLSLSLRDLCNCTNTTEEETSSRKRRRRASSDDNRKIVVVGGPPYTPKPLPQQFILHSIQQLQAELVVFILPERCRKYADHLQQKLNTNATKQSKRKWCYSNSELKNIDFSFEGSTIQQPSVLQCWYKMEIS